MSTTPVTASEAAPAEESGRSRSRLTARLLSQRGTLAWLGFLAVVLVAAIVGPWLSPHDPNKGDLFSPLSGPSGDHWLGTDQLGRDNLTRVLMGGRVALLAGAEAVAVAAIVGIPLGLWMGYVRGWFDRIGMRVVETVVSLPFLVVAIALISITGPGVYRSMFVVGIVYSMMLLRITRGQVLSVREELFVDAARVTGLRRWAIIVRHVLPNVAAPLVVQATLLFANAIIIEATLSFLGLGVTSPTASWGSMLADAQEAIRQAAWLSVPPGAAIALTVLALNQVGDGIRDLFSRDTVHPLVRRRRRPTRPLGAPVVPVVSGSAVAPATEAAVLDIEDLRVGFDGTDGHVEVVRGVSLSVAPGEILALVGESGSGKSVSMLGMLGLLPGTARVDAARIEAVGQSLVDAPFDRLRTIRGRDVGVVFQEPIASLNPAFTIGFQLVEALRTHGSLTSSGARTRAAELLAEVGISNAADRLDDYPHQFSGGMAQRVMIAMALANRPRLLIADEPTTALDVTVQGQIIELLDSLRHEHGMSVVLITHDLGVVADIADRVAVMYAGELVEVADVNALFARPRHPYTAALMASVPRNVEREAPLVGIPGSVPPPGQLPAGCAFAPRCAYAEERCVAAPVELVASGSGLARCVRTDELDLVAVGHGR